MNITVIISCGRGTVKYDKFYIWREMKLSKMSITIKNSKEKCHVDEVSIFIPGGYEGDKLWGLNNMSEIIVYDYIAMGSVYPDLSM